MVNMPGSQTAAEIARKAPALAVGLHIKIRFGSPLTRCEKLTKNGKIQNTYEEETAGFEPTALFHLAADGEIRPVSQPPALAEGEGVLMYTGEFYIEPLEIQVEFVKAASAEKWLEALILRHTERVRQVADSLTVLAEIKEVEA